MKRVPCENQSTCGVKTHAAGSDAAERCARVAVYVRQGQRLAARRGNPFEDRPVQPGRNVV